MVIRKRLLPTELQLVLMVRVDPRIKKIQKLFFELDRPQAKIARALRMSAANISILLAGDVKNPRESTLERLEKYLAEQIALKNGHARGPGLAGESIKGEDMSLDNPVASILTLFKKMSPEDRVMVRGAINAAMEDEQNVVRSKPARTSGLSG